MRENLEKNTDRRLQSMNYIYAQDVNPNKGNENKIESQLTFRKNFSEYSVSEEKLVHYFGEAWNINNLGGVPVDYDSEKKKVFIDSSDAHTLLIGATGSKKSRLVVMPTVKIIASVGESMIISDPKGEIYRRTAYDIKNRGYDVNVINLRNPQLGDKWNFLSIPYKKYLEGNVDKACEMINDAAITLMPLTLKDPYWDYSARDLFVGLTLLLFKICKSNNCPESMVNMKNIIDLRVKMFLSTDTRQIKETLYWKEAEKDNLIKTKLIGTVVCPEKTLSCILSTFDQHVSCFTLNPKMIALLSDSTVDFSDFCTKKKAIFIIMPDEKTTYHKLVSILIKQVYEYLIELTYSELEDNCFAIRVNFILDEFSSLPYISDFPQMIAAARSRNIRFLIVIQSKNQLKLRYKEEAFTIMCNCTNWLFLFTREIELLNDISSLGGVIGKNRGYLIPVSRLQHLNKEKGECLIFSNRLYPYYAHLADIDEFDSGKYKVLPMKKTESIINEYIDIDNLFQRGENNSSNNPVVSLDDLFDDNNT